MKSFVYNGQPARVVFGAGSLQHLAREIDALGGKKALVLSTPEQRASADMIADLLGSRAAGVCQSGDACADRNGAGSP
jgi:maleylacetate reductase